MSQGYLGDSSRTSYDNPSSTSSSTSSLSSQINCPSSADETFWSVRNTFVGSPSEDVNSV